MFWEFLAGVGGRLQISKGCDMTYIPTHYSSHYPYKEGVDGSGTSPTKTTKLDLDFYPSSCKICQVIFTFLNYVQTIALSKTN